MQSDSCNDSANDMDHDQCSRNLLETKPGSDEFLGLSDHDQGGSDGRSRSQGTPRTASIVNKFLDVLSNIFDFRSLKEEPVFTFLFLPCQLLLEISFVSWLFFMVSYAVSVGMTVQKAVFLPMAGSFGGFVGRIVIAVFMNKWPELSPHIHAVNVGITSVGLFLYPLTSSLVFLVFCSFIVGSGFYAANSATTRQSTLLSRKRTSPVLCPIHF